MENNQTNILYAQERGPAPGIFALGYFLLFAGGLAFNMSSTIGAAYPTPYDAVQKAQIYYGTFASTVRIYAFIIFWSALPLGIYTAFMTARLRALNLHKGGTTIALFGGIGASVFIALSALCTWILSQPSITENAGATRAVQLLSFATGGTGHVVLAGLLIAGISVPAGIARIIPKWVMISGIVLASLCVLSMLNMVFSSLFVMLPLGRFGGMIWMIIAGFTIKKSRQL
jgi:hypothetical protein